MNEEEKRAITKGGNKIQLLHFFLDEQTGSRMALILNILFRLHILDESVFVKS